MRDFLKRLVLVCCVSALVLLGCAHVSFADAATDMEAYFAGKESYSGLVDVPGRGLMRYYAQNDTLWGDLAYEKEGVVTRRPFRDSGCSPSSLAMAVASLIPDEELSAISGFAKRAYSLCTCSINKARCTRSHARYVITSPRDYARFLPLIFADFATGNNTMGVVSRNTAAGTGSAYLYKIAEAYGLSITFYDKYAEIKDLVGQDGIAVVALAGRGGCFTTVGHYVFLASRDESNVYILDPLYRKYYDSFNKGFKVNVLQPGLVSMKHSDYWAANFTHFMVLERNPQEINENP